jgi:hypothetical protein
VGERPSVFTTHRMGGTLQGESGMPADDAAIVLALLQQMPALESLELHLSSTNVSLAQASGNAKG